MDELLPVGKLPVDVLAALLARAPISDERVVVGPGVGLDCAVVKLGDRCLVFKSDPITFATADIGRYLVQVNANDIATTGAVPRWLLLTMLLPEGQTTSHLVETISEQVFSACRELDISVIGGHTEITHGLERPLLIGTLVGEVDCNRLVLPYDAAVGDVVLLTKGVPIETTAILAREFPQRLREVLSEEELARARDFLYEPGIGVLRDAQIALAAGRVTAMHDPTEGGLAAALWELADASGKGLVVDVEAVPIPPLAARICRHFDLDPLATIASGALLVTVPASDADAVRTALTDAGIRCAAIGRVVAGPPGVWQADSEGNGRRPLPRPAQDAIAQAYRSA